MSLYTWTKGIAAGAYLIPLLLILARRLPWTSPIWQWVMPVLAGVFLAITGALLIWDLGHPRRFYYIFTRPQWKSWLVRGAFIIAAYSLVVVLHVLAAFIGRHDLQAALVIPGALLAAMTAVYTAYLFAQAKARDLWQNPSLPPHFLLQAVLAGTAALIPLAVWLEPSLVPALLWILGGASLLHILMVAGELTLTHATAHAHLAATEMLAGRYRTVFWTGALLGGVAMFAPWIGPLGAVAALVGLLAYEHAYVQSGQSVPLA